MPVLALDGGMISEVAKRVGLLRNGVPTVGRGWSLRPLFDVQHHAAIAQLHREYHGDPGRGLRQLTASGLLGTSALGGGGWLPLPLGVGAENLLLRGQAYTHWTRAGVTEPNRTELW